jgi:hypothetical protein
MRMEAVRFPQVAGGAHGVEEGRFFNFLTARGTEALTLFMDHA